MQGASEIYAKQHRNISPTATATLLHALEFMHQHAHAIDMDTDLRQKLAVQQAEDRVPDERMVRGHRGEWQTAHTGWPEACNNDRLHQSPCKCVQPY